MAARWLCRAFPPLAALAMLLVAVALPARADDFATLVAALGSDTFAEKEKAIVELGTLGDARAVPILQALSDDRLPPGTNGEVLILASENPLRLVDALTGEAVTGVAPDSLSRVIVNNRLRGRIEGALGGLTLFSSDRNTRLAAARDALKHPPSENAERMRKALAGESDPEVRSAIETSLLAAQLMGGSKDEQRAAIQGLASATDPQIKNLLDEYRAKPDVDPELKKAADAAIVSINRR